MTYPDEVPDYLSDNPHTRTEYDQAGRTLANIDARGNRTEYRYDDAGRLTHTIFADDTPNDLSDNPTTSVTYDKAGRRVADTDALGHTTRYTYDKAGRVITTTFHDNTTTHTAYDQLGRRESVTDQEGNITRYDYDVLGRLSAVRQYLDQDSDSPTELKTEYDYDELGRLIEATDANQHRTRYGYDKLGRRTAVQLPEGQRSSATYDAVGNLTTSTDFNQEVTAYTYDALDRLTVKDYEDDADVSYTYTADGQLATLTDGRGTTTFGYDHQGRLLWRNDPDRPTTADGHTIQYEYDEAGNRTAVITPNGRVDYTFDEQNRLKTVTDPNAGTTTYIYDAAGNLTRTEFPNNTVEIRNYDDLHRLTSLKTIHIDPVSGVETVLSGFEYTLNDVGHRLSVTEFDGRVVNYTYDDLYRLTEENINNGERTITYTYDNVGNRLTRNDSAEGLTTYTYDDNDRLLTEVLTRDDGTTVHTITHSYDDNGNLISRVQETDGTTETTTYTWNDDDRLVAVETPEGNSIAYEYDDQGIRVSATVDGETTEFLVDKNRPYAQVLEEFSSDQLQTFYVYGHDLISQTRNAEQDFYQVDGLGSTRALADEDGNVTDTYDYEAFGELIDSTGESENSYRFTGEQFDAELGDYYLRQRFYDQSMGRLLSRDTYEGRLRHPSSLHKYLYTENNPVNSIDPSGNITLQQYAAASAIGATLSAISAPIANHSLGRKTTVIDIALAATTGAVIGPLSLASPTFGLVVASAGVLSSGYLLYKVFSNDSTWLQKTEAVALTIASLWGASQAFKYYNAVAQTRIPQFPLKMDSPPGVTLESGQPGLLEGKMSQIPGLMKSMANGEHVPPIAGYRDGNRYIITEGNHRMAAALALYKETGNPSYVQQLIQQGSWTNYSPGYINRTYKMTD